MRHILKNLFKKSSEEVETRLPEEERVTFLLKVDNIVLATLSSVKGEWRFEYSDDFKNHMSEYNRIVGFPDLNKVYQSDHLWPFFQIRIPGLGQPEVKEILKTEKIDKENEAELLKRFGRKSIANPYELELA